MARKSSFLQGFEVGTDLYNRGFSQAQSMAEMQQRAKDRQYQIGRDKKEDERADKLLQLREDAQKLSKDRLGIELSAAAQKAKADQKKAENLAKGMGAIKNLSDYLQFFDPLEKPADYKMWLETYPTQMADALLTEQTAKQYEGLIDLVEQGKVHRETIRARAIKKGEDEARRERQNNRQDEISKRRVELGMPDDLDPKVFNSLDGQAKSFSLDISEGLIKLDDPKIIEFRNKFAEAGGDPVKLNNVFKEAYKPVLERERKIAEEGRKAEAEKSQYRFENPDLDSTDPLVDSMALNGQPISDFKTVYPSTTLRAVNARRNEIKQGFVTGKYAGEERIRLSAVFTDKLTQTESESISKSLRTLKQIDEIDFLQEKISTGPVQATLTPIYKLIDNEEGRNRAIFEGSLNAMIPGLARGTYGEVGVLTDADIENYKKTVSSLGQQEAVNRILIDKTRKLVRYSTERQLNDAVSNQKNVAGYLSQYRQVTEGKTYDFPSEGAFNNAREAGEIPPDAKGSYPSKGGGVTQFTMPPKETSEASSQNEKPLQGTREEIQNLINAGKAEGRYKPGQKVPVIDPKTSKQIMLAVPGDMEEGAAPEPKPNMEFNPNEPAEGPKGPIPGADQGVEGETEQEKESPYDPTLQERRKQRMSQYRKQSGASDEPAEGPKGPIPGADQGVEGEMEEAEDITPWESEEERQAMVDGQVKEYRAIQEFQKLADNGGGGDPYSFVRHRVKIGGTTGEIVRTNSRGVFIKIPNGPTRFMSWGGLSKRIESGDFKPNKARLNQQLKGE